MDNATLTTVNTEIGRYIRFVRQNHCYSVRVVAEQLGITYQQLSKYERGDNKVPAALLYRLSKLYKLPVAHFYPPNSAHNTVINKIISELQSHPEEFHHLVLEMLILTKISGWKKND